MEEFSLQVSEAYEKLINKMSMWVEAAFLQLPNIVIALLFVAGAYFLSSYIKKLAVKSSSKFTSNQTILNLVSNVTAVIFGLLVIFVVLSILNLGGTINKILATAGVLGLAVGLALQDPMNNLFSGVFMSVRKLYKIGDLVETNGFFGTIKDIDLRVTTLSLPTGQYVVIPNKDVIQKPLKNYSRSGERRIDISVGVSYGEDLSRVEEIAIEAIKEDIDVKKDKPVDLIYDEFGGSSVNFVLRFWIDIANQKDFLHEKSNAIKVIKKVFDANDISIPYPIRTLDFGIKGGSSLKEMLTTRSNQYMTSEHSGFGSN